MNHKKSNYISKIKERESPKDYAFQCHFFVYLKLIQIYQLFT